MQKEITVDIQPLYNFIKKNYVSIAIICIILLSFYVRILGFNFKYLRNIDSYWHYRYMRMIVENGGIMPAVDPLMEAPEIRKTGYTVFYHYIGAYSFMLFRLFNPNIELWRFLIYFPAFLASLMAIPAYYIGKLIYDKKAGLLTSFFVVFNPAVFGRTLGGDPDSDCIVLLLPLVVLVFFLLAYKSSEISKNISKKTIIYSVLAGLWLAALAYTWVSWHMFYLIAGMVLLKVLVDLLKKTIDISLIVSYIIIIVLFFLLTVPNFGFDFIKTTIMGPAEASMLKAEIGDFPNVYVSVAEMMQSGSIKDIADSVGILFFALTFIFCLPYLTITYLIKRMHFETIVLLLLWIGGFMYASIFAIRFTIFLVFPLALASGIIIAKLWRMILGEDKEIFE